MLTGPIDFDARLHLLILRLGGGQSVTLEQRVLLGDEIFGIGRSVR